MSALFTVGLHRVDDEAIVELYQPQTEPPSSIVATVGELRQLGYWSQHLQWRYAAVIGRQA